MSEAEGPQPISPSLPVWRQPRRLTRLACALMLGWGACSDIFPGARSFATTPLGQGEAVAIADIDADGNLDLVSANQRTGDLSLLLGNGDGSFRASISLPIAPPRAGLGQPEPVAVAVGDLNADGHLDVVAGLAEPTGAIVVLLGNSDGSFAPQTRVAASSRVRAVALADFDGDRRTDVVASTVSSQFDVFRGNGDGTFRAGIQVAGGRQVPGVTAVFPSLVVGDFDNDRAQDVAFVYGANEVVIASGDGRGGFAAPRVIGVPNLATSLGVGDFDADGRTDFAVTTIEGLSVLLQKPDRSFAVNSSALAFAGRRALVATDLEGDGILDLVLTGPVGSEVGVLRGNGDGTFGEPSFLPLGAEPIALAAGDLDHDGLIDIVSGTRSSDVRVLLGSTESGFVAGRLFPVVGTTDSVAVADLDRDGTPDAVSADCESESVSVFTGDGSGGVSATRTFSAGPIGPLPGSRCPRDVTVGDFDGDGITDLVTANLVGELAFLSGAGGGAFAAPLHLSLRSSSSGPGAVAAVELNGDGNLDLVAATEQALFTLLGNGDGTFRRGFTGPERIRGPRSLVTGDFDGDGNLDVAEGVDGGPNAPGGVSIYLGDGLGGFASADAVDAFSVNAKSVAAGDVDGDGNPDLAVAARLLDNTQAVAVLFGDGSGKFARRTDFVDRGLTSVVGVADLNLDGRPDIVAGSASSVRILLAQMDGTFQSTRDIPSGPSATDFAIADLDADGVPDLVTDGGQDKISILINQTPRAPALP